MNEHDGRRFTRAMGRSNVTAKMAIFDEINQGDDVYVFTDITEDGGTEHMVLQIEVGKDKGSGASLHFRVRPLPEKDEWTDLLNAEMLIKVMRDELFDLGIIDKNADVGCEIGLPNEHVWLVLRPAARGLYPWDRWTIQIPEDGVNHVNEPDGSKDYNGRRFTRTMGDSKVTAEMVIDFDDHQFKNITVDGKPACMELIIDVHRDKGYGQDTSYSVKSTDEKTGGWVCITSAAMLARAFEDELIELGILYKLMEMKSV